MIVLDLDGGDMLESCLRSIVDQKEKPTRIIVFDNGSAIPVSSRLPRSRINDVHILRSEENLGFTGGINAAMTHVTADYVGWINNDVVLDPCWLGRLRRVMDVEERVAAVQPIIMSDAQYIDGAGISKETGRFEQLGHGMRLDGYRAREAWGVSGTASMFRVSALNDVGIGGHVLHPAFFAYYEDVELSARLRDRGWHCAVVAEPLANHRGSATASRIQGLAMHLRVRNRYFVRRLHPDVGRFASLLAEDFRAIVKKLTRLEIVSALSHSQAVLAGLFGPLRDRPFSAG